MRLTDKLRTRWKDTTMVAITHDVEDALKFDFVVVVEGGRVVEAGTPNALDHQGTLFQQLLHEYRLVQEEFWENREKWTRLNLKNGRLTRDGVLKSPSTGVPSDA